MPRLIVYGDIHGCIDEFKELREKIGIQDGDIEYAIGDLLDRGKDSLAVLRYARENNIKSILGNHEVKYVKYRRYSKKKTKKNTPPKLDNEQKELYEKLEDDDFKYLESMKYFEKFDKITLVHAGIRNNIKLSADTPKKELEQLLFIRYLDENENVVGLGYEKKQDRFWSEYYDGKEGYVVYGHSVFKEVREDKHSMGIDTGCVYGNKLSAVVFEDVNDPTKRKIVSVEAKMEYAEKIENPKIKYAQFFTIYSFRYNKGKFEKLANDGILKQTELKSETGDMLEHIKDVFKSDTYPTIYQGKGKQVLGITCQYGELKLEERFFVLCNDEICLLVDKFSSLEEITYQNYLDFVKSMCVLKRQNKTKLTVFRNTQNTGFPYFVNNYKVSYGSEKEVKDFKDKHIEHIEGIYHTGKEYFIKYKTRKQPFISENTIADLKKLLEIDEKEYSKSLQKSLDEQIFKNEETYVFSLKDYIDIAVKDLKQDVSKSEQYINNLSSYHLLDNDQNGVSENLIDSIVKYANKIDTNKYNQHNSFEKFVASKNNIITYSSGNVVVHVGRKIFSNKGEDGKTNLKDNYTKKHFFVYVFTLIQSNTVINLISRAIFKNYNRTDMKRMSKLKEDSFHFLSHINFEKISHSFHIDKMYKFYRKQLDIDSLKNEVLLIIDKIGSELEKRHKENIEFVLILLTIFTTFTALGDAPNSIETISKYPLSIGILFFVIFAIYLMREKKS